VHIETPLIESLTLAEGAPVRVWLKVEALQPTGSFKIRGIGAACIAYRQRGACRFVCSSGGNAGIAVAHAGRELAVPVVVVVPSTTTEWARTLIEREGAALIVHGDSWVEANQHASSLLEAGDAFLHPFDDPLIWRGHSSLIDEVDAAGLVPDAVILSVGGGGLLCGVAEGMARAGWGEVPITAVETEGADSYARAIAAGKPVTLPAITSIATSLGASRVCDRALEWSWERPIRNVRVSDRQAVDACTRFLDEHRLLVEPACGAALAAVYDRSFEIDDLKDLLEIVCGGATMSLAVLERFSASV
jgi:L-serine/L-threonine ammonia-lyase